MLILMMMTISVSATVYYPPQATYNWVQGDKAGNTQTSITNSRIYLRVGVNTGRNYVVTNAVDLSKISYLEVNWSGYLTQWSTAFWDANVTFGISNNAGDDSFLTSVNHDGDGSGAFGSFNTTDYLDVSSYTGSYFLKFGGELTKVNDFAHYLYMYLYDVIGHNYTESMPLNATSRTTTSVTLNGKVTYSDDTENICGFWYGNSLPLDGTNNVTCSGTYTDGETFSKSISGLTSGDYYYVQSWTNNSLSSFNLSSNYSYFITLPDSPSGLSVANTGANSADLVWTNATVPVGTNLSVYIRWKNGTTPPTSRTDGTFGANTSGNNSYTIGGLPFEQQVSFALWTYINNSGSPSRSGWSASPATTSGTTAGAIYNVTVRYENETEAGNRPVDLREYADTNHSLYIYCDEATYQVRINKSGVWWVSNGITLVDDNTDNGKYKNFSISVNETVNYFEFRWNDTFDKDRYCNRKIVPYNLSIKDNTYALDFYVRIDLLVYPESSPYSPNPDGNKTLCKYNYGYIDQTGDFLDPDNEAFCIIYKFNSSGKKMIIHSEYFDQQQKTYPWLVYQDTYYQGVKCTITYYERIGQAPATSTLDVTEIVIPETFDSYYVFDDLIQVDYGWNANGIYVHYQDTTFSTSSVNYSLYGYFNDSLMDYEQVAVNDKWFYYTLAENINISKDYYFRINVTLSGDVSQYYEGNYSKVFVVYSNENISVIGNDTIDDILTGIFGDSPFFDVNNPDVFVPWTYLILFAICFIEMTTFGKLNAFLGSLAVGATLLLGGVLISGISVLFEDYTFQGAILATIGVFMIAISIIGLIGGAEK